MRGAEGKPTAAPTWPEVQASLRASSGASLLELYEALFNARDTAPCPEAASAVLVDALDHVVDSVLLRHEICYILGQIGDCGAAKRLHAILADESEHEVVRHEAAEALAALGPSACGDVPGALVEELEVLARDSSSQALRHTCELAAEGLRRQAETGSTSGRVCCCQYDSVDPALGKTCATAADISEAATALLDESRPLFERYQHLFTLRNVGGSEAVAALSRALLEDRSSALLRHEIAFVFGQMARGEGGCPLGLVGALQGALARPDEAAMVRHEAAISLGSVGTPEAQEALLSFQADAEALISESCRVALGTSDFFRSWAPLQAT